MTADSMAEIVDNIQSIYNIIIALAIAEAFNQAVRETKPSEERHATTFANWFECVHPSRMLSLIVFLLLAITFFQGNQRYLYLQYIEPLHGLHPVKTIKSAWLDFDCLVFSLESGLLFVMSRSLSARRWQQFYATVAVLYFIDAIWALVEVGHGSAVPHSWIPFDIMAVLVLTAVIAIDWFFVPYARNEQLNVYCYAAVTVIAIVGLTYGYWTDFDYLIEGSG